MQNTKTAAVFEPPQQDHRLVVKRLPGGATEVTILSDAGGSMTVILHGERARERLIEVLSGPSPKRRPAPTVGGGCRIVGPRPEVGDVEWVCRVHGVETGVVYLDGERFHHCPVGGGTRAYRGSGL